MAFFGFRDNYQADFPIVSQSISIYSSALNVLKFYYFFMPEMKREEPFLTAALPSAPKGRHQFPLAIKFCCRENIPGRYQVVAGVEEHSLFCRDPGPPPR